MSVTEIKDSCLSEEQCQDFLKDNLSGDISAAIVEHIECCERCQESMESLTSPDCDLILNPAQRNALSKAIKRTSQRDSMPDPGEATTGSFAGLATSAFGPSAEISQETPDIPGYEDLEQIATGGMGTVYRARQKHLDRDVAIKVLRGFVSADNTQRFSREMLAIGKLEHDHIVRAYDAGEANGIPYFVMELLQGKDLRAFVRPDSLGISIKEACNYIRQAALGLQIAHDAGFIHRDVKPSNLMLTADGTVKLLDLGLVHVNDSKHVDGEITDEGSILGSLDYIAPEQGRETHTADARSDVYSLGCTLFALLTRRAPFTGAGFQTAQQKLLAHACEERPRVRHFNSNVPQGLCDVVFRMMSTAPAERPQTAAKVAELLLPFCGEGDGPRRPGFSVAGMAGSFGLLFLCALIVIKFKDGTTMTIETDKPVAGIEVKSETGPESNELSGLSDQLREATEHRQLVKVFQQPKYAITGFCFAPGMKQAYSTDQFGGVQRWDINGGTAKPVYQFQAARMSAAIAVTPDGRGLFVGGGFGFAKLDTGAGTNQWTVPGSSHNWASVVPGTDLIAVGRRAETTIRRISDGVTVTTSRIGRTEKPNFTADGKRMAVCLRDINVAAIVDLTDDGLDVKKFSADNFKATDVAFTADEQHLVAVGGDATVVWDIETGKVIRSYKTRNRRPQDRIERVGDSGLFLTLRGVMRNQLVLWNVFDNTTHLEIDVPPTFRYTASPDGKFALTSDFVSDRLLAGGTLRLWSLDPFYKPSGGLSIQGKTPRKQNQRRPSKGTVINGDRSIQWPASAPDFATVPFDAKDALRHQKQWAQYLGVPVRMVATSGIKLTLIPPGKFAMGATDEQIKQTIQQARTELRNRFNEPRLKTCLSSQPKHHVRLSHALMMSEFEVTVAEFCKVTGEPPAKAALWLGRTDGTRLKELNVPNCPAHTTWIAAVRFCNQLSEQEGLTPYYKITDGADQSALPLYNGGYRLPSEAEWEFACRSGSDDRFWTDDVHLSIEDYAWFRSPDVKAIHDAEPVGQKLPNAFGLYDMHGNLSEWCFDFFDWDSYVNSTVDDPIGPETGSLHVRRGSDQTSHGHNIGNWVRGVPNSPWSAGAIRIVRSILPGAMTEAIKGSQ